MNIKFEQQGLSLKVVVPSKRKSSPRRWDVSSLCFLEKKQREKIIEHSNFLLCKISSEKTCAHMCSSLQSFGRFLKHSQIKQFPDYSNDDEWQYIISQFYLWYISDQIHSKAKLTTRCKTWMGNIRSVLDSFRETGLIPFSIIIPSGNLPSVVSKGAPQKPLLIGERNPQKVKPTSQVQKYSTNNTLAGSILWSTDVEYLDQIEAKLRMRDAVLLRALDDYWDKLIRDYRTGDEMLESISDQELDSRIQTGEWTTKKGQLLASSSNSDGHLWALKIMAHQLKTSNDQFCLSANKLREHPAFSASFLNGKKGTPSDGFYNASSLLAAQKKIIPFSQLLFRFLKVLTISDIAVAMAIIIREHPNLNPESLAGAKLISNNGRYLLLIADNGGLIFSVDKPRANTRKYALLTPRAKEIIQKIIESTEKVRELLKRSNNSAWRFLFVGNIGVSVNNPGLGHPAVIPSNRLNNIESGFSLVRAYPELLDAGLEPGTLSFSKIRNTQGVLAWFDKGSVQACSRKLGNSIRTTINHYLPKPLMDAWNERIIRRFQNTLIIISASDENYLLEVVDIPTISELHYFIAQLIYESPLGFSPISDKIHSKFASRYFIDTNTAIFEKDQIDSSILNVKIQPSSLALIIAYREWALKILTSEQRRIPDNNGIMPEQFIHLGEFLQIAAQAENTQNIIPFNLNIPMLNRAYQKAVKMVPEYLSRIESYSFTKSSL